jgi:hypothetical protein
MKKLFTRKNLTFVGIFGALLFAAAFSVPQASANTGEFDLDVAHLINGKQLDLNKELPVNVYINNQLAIPDFRFGEKISTTLPAGTYTINVTLLDGTPLPSMTVGPVSIPADVDVNVKALLDRDDTPYLNVKTSGDEEEMISDGDFDVKVRHSIDGRRLGLNKDLPVNVYINGALAIPDFRFGDFVETSLPANTYTIAVTLADGTPLPTMNLGPIDIPADADLTINAKLTADKTPILFVNVK